MWGGVRVGHPELLRGRGASEVPEPVSELDPRPRPRPERRAELERLVYEIGASSRLAGAF